MGNLSKSHKFDRLKGAVTSRALFDLTESDRVFKKYGIQRFIRYQSAHEKQPLKPGAAFSLVQGLLWLKHPVTKEPLAEVYLISKNDPSTGFRICDAIEKTPLGIERLIFTGGEAHHDYIKELDVDLFLSADEKDVREALNDLIPAAKVLPYRQRREGQGPLRFAFDGDAVIFSDEAERVYQTKGLKAFNRHEMKRRNIPIGAGPFYKFLVKVHQIQKLFPWEKNPIKTALFTARDNAAYKRAINTLRHWNIRINEAFFLGGRDKSGLLSIYGPHIFFDDQQHYCLPASKKVAVGHVPFGVKNKPKSH